MAASTITKIENFYCVHRVKNLSTDSNSFNSVYK